MLATRSRTDSSDTGLGRLASRDPSPWPTKSTRPTLPLRLHKSAVAEAKRLLYVSMTRARDLLILARSRRSPTGEWLETVDAPWLLPTSPADALTLPSGEAIDALHWDLDPIDPSEATTTAGQPVFWFRDPATHSTKLPLVFNPSAATSPDCKVLEQIPLGNVSRLPPAPTWRN